MSQQSFGPVTRARYTTTIAGPQGPQGPPGAAAGQIQATLVNGLNSNIATNGQPTVRIAGPSAAFSVGGFQLPGAATPQGGQILVITNSTSQPMTIVHEDTSSAAVARIDTQSNLASVVLQARTGTCIFVFDSTTSRWRLQSTYATRPLKFAVKDFGAVGDDSHDDTANINAAISAAVAVGSQGIFLHTPISQYKITSTIVLPVGYLRIEGEGPGVSVRQATAGQHVFSDGGSALNALQFEHLWLWGQGASSGSNGIDLTGGGYGHKFRDVQCGTTGSDTAFQWGIHLLNCPSYEIKGCAIWQCVQGVRIEASSNAGVIQGNQFRVCTDTGLCITSGVSPQLPTAGATVHGNRFEENTNYGLQLDTVSGVDVRGNYFESQGIYAVAGTSWDIYLSTTAQTDADRPFGNFIEGNTFRGSAFTPGSGGEYTGSILVHSGKQNVVRGNYFVTNSNIQIDSGAILTQLIYPAVFGGVNVTDNGQQTVRVDLGNITTGTMGSDAVPTDRLIQAQSAYASASTNVTGADLNLAGGNSKSGNILGTVRALVPGTTDAALSVGGSGGLQRGYNASGIALTTGTVTLTPTQYAYTYLNFTGSLSGNVTIVLPNLVGSDWVVDATACTLNGQTITLQVAGNNWGTTIGKTNLYKVTVGGGSNLFGATLTP